MKGVIWNWGDPTYHQKVKKTRIRIIEIGVLIRGSRKGT